MLARDLATERTQLIEEFLSFFFARRLTVPPEIALDGADTFAGDGMREYECRLFCDCLCLIARRDNPAPKATLRIALTK